MTNQEKITKLDSERAKYIFGFVSKEEYLQIKAYIWDEAKPKIQADFAWFAQVWHDFASRRAAVIAGTFDDNYDYSSNGEPPYPAAELLAEIGG